MQNLEFETVGFRDTEDVVKGHINGIEGQSLAQQVKARLLGNGCQCEEIFQEDYGWVFYAARGGERYFFTFSVDPANLDNNLNVDQRVSDGTLMNVNINIEKHRSLKDKLLGRNRMQQDDPVSSMVREFLGERSECGQIASRFD